MDGNPGIAAPAVSLGLPSNADVQHDSSTSQGSGADAFAVKYFFEDRTHKFDAALMSFHVAGTFGEHAKPVGLSDACCFGGFR